MATVQMPDGQIVDLPDNPDDDQKEKIRQIVEANRQRQAQPQGGSPTPTPAPAVERTGETGFVFAPRSGSQEDVSEARQVAEIPQVQAAGEAAVDLAKGVPGMVASLPRYAAEGTRLAVGGPSERAQIIGDALKEAVPMGEQLASDVKAPLGTRESFRGLAQILMMGAPAVGEIAGDLFPRSVKPPIQTEPANLREAFNPMFGETGPKSDIPLTDAATEEVTDASKITGGERLDLREQGSGVGEETPLRQQGETPETTTSEGGETPATSSGGAEITSPESAPVRDYTNLKRTDRTGSTPASPPKTYDEAQSRVDAIEDRLVKSGVDVGKTYNPNDPGADVLKQEGWTPMPDDLVQAYKDRDAIGGDQLAQNVKELSSKLSGTGLSKNEINTVLGQYAIRGNPHDPVTQYMASEHTVELAKLDPERQAERLAYGLAADRGEQFDELRDVSPKTLRDAAKAVRAVREYLGLSESKQPKLDTGNKPAPKLLTGETQGDLISSTQEEPLKLVGEETVDHEARQLEEEAKSEERAQSDKQQTTFDDLEQKVRKDEQALFEKKLREEQEGLLEEVEAHQARGGDALSDLLKRNSLQIASEAEQYTGELDRIRGMFQRQKGKSGFGKLIEGNEGNLKYRDVFRKGGLTLDQFHDLLVSKGFDVENISDTLDLIENHLRTGREFYGSEARAEEGGITGLGGYAMGAAGTAEFPGRITGMKNAIVDAERVKRGEAPLMSEARKAMEKTWDEAMARIDEGERRGENVGHQLVDDINSGARTDVNATDQAILLHERIRVGNEQAMAADRINDPNTSQTDLVQARNQWADAEDRLNQTELALRASGTIAGRALQIRQMLARDDYTYAGIERRMRAAQNGAPLDDLQKAKIAELSKKIADLEKKLAERQTKQAEAEAQGAFDTELSGLKRRAGRKGGGAEELSLDDQREKIIDAIHERALEGESPEDIGSLVHQLALNFVRSGITEREALIDAVHNVIGEPFDIARHITRDLISGYGEFKTLDPEAAKVTLRQLKGEMQQISKIEDMAGGQAPKKTGVERRTPSDEERRLIRQVNEMKKKGGFEVTDPARQLKSALDAVKTRLMNQIRDLDNALRTSTPIEVKKGGIPYDAAALRMKEIRDQLKAHYDEVFGKKGLTDEQRLKLAEGAAERSLKDWDKRLADAKQGKFEGKPAKTPVSSAKLDAIRAQREAIKAEVEALQKVNPQFQALKEQKALALRKAYLTRRIAELQDKFDRGDFTREPKRKPREDAQTVQLQGDLAKLTTKVRQGIAEAEFNAQPAIIRGLQHVAGVARLGALSGYHTLGKLFGFSVGHIVEKPFTELTSAVLERTPGFKQVYDKADIYKGGHVQALATYYRTLFTKGIKEAGEYLRTGTTGEESQFGRPYIAAPHWYDFVGTLHGAEKQPITTAAREMFRQRAIENAIQNGLNPSDPVVRGLINQKTFEYANAEKLQENNKFAEGVNAMLKRLEQVDPKTGRVSIEKQLLSSVIRTLFTKDIIKTPANFAKQLLVDYNPVGLFRGTAKTIGVHIRGIETLTPHEANSIARLMGVGAVGSAMMLWGALDALRDPKDRIFGGFYQPGQKRDPDDVPWGSTRIGDQTFHVLTHNMLTEPAQFGSTIVRVARTIKNKQTGDTRGAIDGIITAAFHVLDAAPIANPITRTSKYVEQGQSTKVASNIVRQLIPQLVQNIAEDTDKVREPEYRRPKSFTDDLMMGIPGLRQNVPTNEDSNSRGGGIKVRP